MPKYIVVAGVYEQWQAGEQFETEQDLSRLVEKGYLREVQETRKPQRSQSRKRSGSSEE